jgi:hypothetical protein
MGLMMQKKYKESEVRLLVETFTVSAFASVHTLRLSVESSDSLRRIFSMHEDEKCVRHAYLGG